MGLYLSKFWSTIVNLSSMPPSRILMLGLDAAGKTTILFKIKLNENVNTLPTIGFNVESVEPLRGVKFTVWDVGGQEKIRRLWRHYYHGTDGLIYVVDSSDEMRMAEAREELFGILSDVDMHGVPIVILANKQDMPNALRLSDITERLELRKLRDHEWFIQSSCALTGDGLLEGMEKMASMVNKYQKTKSF